MSFEANIGELGVHLNTRHRDETTKVELKFEKSLVFQSRYNSSSYQVLHLSLETKQLSPTPFPQNALHNL